MIRFDHLLAVFGIVLVTLITIAVGLRGARLTPITPVEEEVPGGSPEQGQLLIREYGCGACHTIPGLRGANGKVGPPLEDMQARSYVAGNLRNNPDNLVRWIMNPQDVEPGTAMPDLEVSEQDARDIAAYLYAIDR